MTPQRTQLLSTAWGYFRPGECIPQPTRRCNRCRQSACQGARARLSSTRSGEPRSKSGPAIEHRNQAHLRTRRQSMIVPIRWTYLLARSKRTVQFRYVRSQSFHLALLLLSGKLRHPTCVSRLWRAPPRRRRSSAPSTTRRSSRNI